MGLRFSYLNPFIPHRMTTAERDAEEWPNYAVIENTDTNRIQQIVAEVWVDIAQVYGTPSDEDYLVWNSTEEYFEPKSPTEVLAILSGEAAADFAMNSKKITGLAAADSNGDAVRYEQLHAVESGESGTHNHGNLYYTEGEVDGLLHAESHTHQVRNAITIPLKKALPGIANDAAEQPLSAPFALTNCTKLKARARSNMGAETTFRVTIAGTDRGSVTIASGASVGTATVSAFSIAEDAEVDIDQTAGGTDDVAVAVLVVGEQETF